MDKMITRSEACETLYELLESGILNDELDAEIQDIANCIAMEDNSLHIWGAKCSDINKIVTSKRADLITDEYIHECTTIINKYKYGLSKFEKENENEGRNKDGEVPSDDGE